MLEINYNERLYNDIQLVKSSRKADKRELAILTGASILGLTCYGIMKHVGYDDLYSNVPAMCFFGLSYLEYLYYRKEALKASERLKDLAVQTVDSENYESFFNGLLSADHSSEIAEVSDKSSNKTTLVDEYAFEDDNLGRIVQVTEVVEDMGEVTKKVKTLKLSKEEANKKSFL